MMCGSRGCSDRTEASSNEASKDILNLIDARLEHELELQTRLFQQKLQQKLQEEREAMSLVMDAMQESFAEERRERQTALGRLAVALAGERAAREIQLSSLWREFAALQASSASAPRQERGGCEVLASPAADGDAQLRQLEDPAAAERDSREAGLIRLLESLLREIATLTQISSDSAPGDTPVATQDPFVDHPAETLHAIANSASNVGRSRGASGAMRIGGPQVQIDPPTQLGVASDNPNSVGAANSSVASAYASSTLARRAPRAASSAVTHPVVTSTLLDRGGMYVPKLSLWDVMLFVGHECVGPSVSVVICIAWLFNFALQATFIAIVFYFMLDESVTDDMLQGLLQFRLGPAHSIEFADPVSQRSLAAQVCEHDFKLPVAGGQEGLLDTIRDFSGGGFILSILATSLWLMTVMQDVQETTNFMQAFLSVRRGSYTSVRFVDSDHLSEDGTVSARASHRHSRSSADESLITLIKVARLTRLGHMRAIFIFFVVVLPKLLIGVVAGIVGAIWLAHTNKLEDLVLNAVALAFVLDIDDVIFSIFVPRRARTLMANLEPLPLPARKSLTSRCPGLNSICKMLLLIMGATPVVIAVLAPEYLKQQQAMSFLCSGTLDFVYATNKATDMVHVAKSSRSTGWTYSELSILQAAQVEIESDWGLDGVIYEALASGSSAVVLPSGPTLSEAPQIDEGFPFILEMSQWSVEEAARVLPCKDLASGQSEQAAVLKLRDLFRDADLSISGCEDIPKLFCSERHMTELRAICPNHCECDRYRAAAGFFDASSFGCPTQCESFKAAFNEIEFRFRQIGSFQLKCEDFTPEQLGVVGSCVDQDRNKFDYFGDACDPWYTDRPSHCLIGSNSSDSSHFVGMYDDDDFTATILCCGCGGGNRMLRVTPAECFRDFSDDCYQLPQDVKSWVLYIRGMWEALSSRFAYNESVALVLNSGQLGGPLNEASREELNAEVIETVTSGTLAENIASGNWDIVHGFGHPRNLTGCEFLTSHEIRGLLNVDLCSPAEGFTPLSFFCPTSCGCGPASTLGACPAACVLNSFEDGFDHPWFGGQSILVPNLRHEELPYPAPFNDPVYVSQLPYEISRLFSDSSAGREF